VNNDDIVLYADEIDIDSIYTWKILSKDDEINLPDVHVASWHTFSWWYSKNKFLGTAWDKIRLWNLKNSESEKSDSTVEDSIEIYACVSSEGFTWDSCISNESEKSDLEISGESNDSVYEPIIEVYTPSEEDLQKYSKEMFDAYNRAINKW
jgi:hypothetical protein